MDLSSYVSKTRVCFLQSTDRDGAIQEMATAIADDLPRAVQLSADKVFALFNDREAQVSTRLAPGIALPHVHCAQVPDTMMAFGISTTGVTWDFGADEPVQLILAILWKTTDHIRILSEVARRLSDPDIVSSILAADDPVQVIDLFLGRRNPVRSATAGQASPISTAFLRHAINLAVDTAVRALILHPDTVGTGDFGIEDTHGVPVFLVSADPGAYTGGSIPIQESLQLAGTGLSRSNLIQLSLMTMISRRSLNRGDAVLSVFADEGSEDLNAIVLTDVEREYEVMFAIQERGGVGDLDDAVFARVVQIATELAQEGREGKPAGTLFVLGDYEHVSQHSQQLVINPFHGYPEEDRNVLDPRIEETIKEFSRIDGAFIVRGDGVIVSAGTYLRTEVPFHDVPSGLGARHAAAATITAVTAASALAISESTKRISLFRGGVCVLRM